MIYNLSFLAAAYHSWASQRRGFQGDVLHFLTNLLVTNLILIYISEEGYLTAQCATPMAANGQIHAYLTIQRKGASCICNLDMILLLILMAGEFISCLMLS